VTWNETSKYRSQPASQLFACMFIQPTCVHAFTLHGHPQGCGLVLLTPLCLQLVLLTPCLCSQVACRAATSLDQLGFCQPHILPFFQPSISTFTTWHIGHVTDATLQMDPGQPHETVQECDVSRVLGSSSVGTTHLPQATSRLHLHHGQPT
jgi:hypothetical protein